ncbi:MAG: hypothetical protein IPG63_14240 [Xanthomonadales bacterium]|nr:hypothetical protein [Xanthomonadales bacterium]MBK7146686.1 hypothetical protein [Xanthomonadales bacterium]MCC6562868.1 hypothetical protein [Xanthomonadales bacterium]
MSGAKLERGTALGEITEEGRSPAQAHRRRHRPDTLRHAQAGLLGGVPASLIVAGDPRFLRRARVMIESGVFRAIFCTE